MGIVNRRNAVVGWIVVKTGKAVARKKARQAKEAAPGAPAAGAAAGALAAIAGVLLFWRRKRGGDDGEA